jgi:hypothetical protein
MQSGVYRPYGTSRRIVGFSVEPKLADTTDVITIKGTLQWADIFGRWFGAGDNVYIYIDGREVVKIRADSSGNFSHSVSASSLGVGNHEIYAIAKAGDPWHADEARSPTVIVQVVTPEKKKEMETAKFSMIGVLGAVIAAAAVGAVALVVYLKK